MQCGVGASHRTEAHETHVPCESIKHDEDRAAPVLRERLSVGPAASRDGPWHDYLSRVLDLCRTCDGAPSKHLLRPPPELKSRRRQADQSPASAYEGMGDGNLSTGNADVSMGRRDSSSTGAPSKEPILILLDMNGTLLYRAKQPLPLDVAGGASAPAFVHGSPSPFEYYMRPGAAEFVAEVTRHPRARLAFYTSMRRVNALPAARYLMPDDLCADRQPEVYDRRFNVHDPAGVNHWDTTRNLPLIWSTTGRVGTGFGPANTLMVDDTPRKMRFMNAGLVLVPEYTREAVIAVCSHGAGEPGDGGTHDSGESRAQVAEANRQTTVMPRLTEYILHLLDQSGADVRPYLEAKPFRPYAMAKEHDGYLADAREAHTTVNTDDGSAIDALEGATDSDLSLSDAVGVLLTTGPLARTRHFDGRECLQGDARIEEGVLDTQPVGASEDICDLSDVERMPMASVTELLETACEAAERWALSQTEQDRLGGWSRSLEVNGVGR